MKRLVLLDEGDFSFMDEIYQPLGGAQSAFIGLVRGLSELGFLVEVRNFCPKEFSNERINWRKLDYNEKFKADGYIINRSAKLLKMIPKKSKILFWLHNRGNYLIKIKNLKYLIGWYPTLVYSGNYHRSTFYLWPFFKNRIYPYGLNERFFEEKKQISIAGPRAIFTSNPLRSLDWLVDRWIQIRERVPNAELHVFTGPSPYGGWGQKVAINMEKAIDYARAHQSYGIVIHEPISKMELCKEIQKSRVMLYRGDVAETFCLSIAESLELGIPCVTMDLGSMKERIPNEENGFVLKDENEFEDRAVELLVNDQLWQKINKKLLEDKVNNSWTNVAKMFVDNF